MKRKGFTLVELLVVIAIIALLMGILMPALARVRQIAHRMICGTNLSGIGKSMLIYGNDYDDQLPIAGGKGNYWADTGTIHNWEATSASGAYFAGRGVTITSSFYLLIKYSGATQKQFLCRGDTGVKEFKPASYAGDPEDVPSYEEAWDFGTHPSNHCSYSYHLPYNQTNGDPGFPINMVSQSTSPLCADRNPYLDKNAESYLNDDTIDDPSWDGHYVDEEGKGNAAAHQRDGQNVLFNDSHVRFEKFPNVGISDDNIWKRWTSRDPQTPPVDAAGRQLGEEAPSGVGSESSGMPRAEEDAYLVNEDQRVPEE